MNNLTEKERLKSLKNARWDIAAKAYGNNHSTLIGLLVDWWISLSKNNHWALDGGPTNGYQQKGIRGQCDALFCRDNTPVGVLEVEGTRHNSTVEKIGRFFDAKYEELKSLEFGILLLYTYKAKGSGENRKFPEAAVPEALQEILIVTKKHPEKFLIVIPINKNYVRQKNGIRARNDYYMGEINNIEGRLYKNGKIIEILHLYKNNQITKRCN